MKTTPSKTELNRTPISIVPRDLATRPMSTAVDIMLKLGMGKERATDK